MLTSASERQIPVELTGVHIPSLGEGLELVTAKIPLLRNMTADLTQRVAVTYDLLKDVPNA